MRQCVTGVESVSLSQRSPRSTGDFQKNLWTYQSSSDLSNLQRIPENKTMYTIKRLTQRTLGDSCVRNSECNINVLFTFIERFSYIMDGLTYAVHLRGISDEHGSMRVGSEARRNDGILRQQLYFRLDVLTRLFLQFVAELHSGEDVWDLQEVLQHLNVVALCTWAR